eukprot:scaffold2022_cov261-Pinguiococcus_pyrenoidosus.AAC.25
MLARKTTANGAYIPEAAGVWCSFFHPDKPSLTGLAPTQIRKDGFKSLEDGEQVEYTVVDRGGRPVATNVTGPDGAQPVGERSGSTPLRMDLGPAVVGDIAHLANLYEF